MLPTLIASKLGQCAEEIDVTGMRGTILRIQFCVLSIRSTDRLICFRINPGAKRFINLS